MDIPSPEMSVANTSHVASPSTGGSRVPIREGSEVREDIPWSSTPGCNTTHSPTVSQEDYLSVSPRSGLGSAPQSTRMRTSSSDMPGHNTFLSPSTENEKPLRFWTRASNSISEGPFEIYEDPVDYDKQVRDRTEPDDEVKDEADESTLSDTHYDSDQENIDPGINAPDSDSVDPFAVRPDSPTLYSDRYREEYLNGDWPTINGRRVLATLFEQEVDDYESTYDDQSFQTGRLHLGQRREGSYARRTSAPRVGVRRVLKFNAQEVREGTPELEEGDDQDEET
ncbi:hypothetical protein N7535_008495 [Penicillium sp. DV-2018c]|nr:hypothetical protein N7461_002255 [Penicillium sp. DV-2018c]KAJ5563331.1 hypothetical protein N7535_008495 [Penicillium sp. DV-2018c]